MDIEMRNEIHEWKFMTTQMTQYAIRNRLNALVGADPQIIEIKKQLCLEPCIEKQFAYTDDINIIRNRIYAYSYLSKCDKKCVKCQCISNEYIHSVSLKRIVCMSCYNKEH